MGGRGGSSGFSGFPKKQTFDYGAEGYKISWKRLEEKINKEYPKENFKNGSRDWYVSNWQKGDYDRSYINVREYKNGSLRHEINLGYYDNKNGNYIVTDKNKTVYDVISRETITPPKKKRWRR